MIKDELKLVPHLPGSYQMYNEDDMVIYVGKAKDLKNRLSSYFTGLVTGKTAKMVSEIKYFKYIITATETEAFILELNLIKKYDPKYNILLKDDKSYPYIEYTVKPYPKLKIVRYLKVKKNKNKKLFGPYPNQNAARRIVNLINRLYPLKKCDNMPKEVCLYYHIGECLGYCQKKVDSKKVKQMENEIISFLKGDEALIKNKILEKIKIHSDNMNYEAALELKIELEYISQILMKQRVELNDLVDRDIINYYVEDNYISIEIFFIRMGKLLGNKNEIIELMNDCTNQIENYMGIFYTKNEIPSEIIVPDNFHLDILNEVLNTKVKYAKKGIKKKILDLVKTNAKVSLTNKLTVIKNEEYKTVDANYELRNILGLKKLYRIDVFDNSNLFGEYCVSAMVVFKDGKPSKSDYRKYKIKIDKNDDYNTMKEVLYRRYYRMLIEKSEKPDLIIVDGGKNQINAALEIINSLNLNIMIIGLKKDDKHRTSTLVLSNNKEINIDHFSNVFHYLTRMQDEVHRYVITYHRTIRDKGAMSSILETVNGIGKKRQQELLKKYKTLDNIYNASNEELSVLIPKKYIKGLKEKLKKLI